MEPTRFSRVEDLLRNDVVEQLGWRVTITVAIPTAEPAKVVIDAAMYNWWHWFKFGRKLRDHFHLVMSRDSDDFELSTGVRRRVVGSFRDTLIRYVRLEFRVPSSELQALRVRQSYRMPSAELARTWEYKADTIEFTSSIMTGERLAS